MKRLVASRWFVLADLALVSISVILWELNPELGWRPLLIALIPWVLRITAGKVPFKSTKLDILILVFLLTAGMGVWAAYDRDTAWAKFWLLAAAALMFYAYAGQPDTNFWLLAGYLAFIGFGMAIFFWLSHDWSLYPAKFDLLTQIGVSWMEIRPAVLGNVFAHPNDIAGIMAMMLPFGIASLWQAWSKKARGLFLFLAILNGFVLISIIFTSSRGAWMAAAAALAVYLLWVFSGIAQRFARWRKEVVFVAMILASGAVGTWLVLSDPARIVDLAGSIPGPNSAIGRFELATAAVKLIQDYPFTGGGLQSFPGLYSQYILVIPNFITSISHNMFLDIALEQGILGLLSFVGILFGGVWLLVKADLGKAEAPLRWALIASTLVMAVHGLVDDIVYNVWGAPELLLLSGFSLGVALNHSQINLGLPRFLLGRPALGIMAAAVIFLLVILFNYRSQILASWHANLGAVHMARVELAGFPINSWDDGSNVPKLASARFAFDRALDYDPNNRAANHRLGLIAMQKRQYDPAVGLLEEAYRAAPDHPGIRKSLGYSYTWAGSFDQALELLQAVPEARNEMSSYQHWWKSQGRDDLSSNAFEIASRLAAADASTD